MKLKKSDVIAEIELKAVEGESSKKLVSFGLLKPKKEKKDYVCQIFLKGFESKNGVNIYKIYGVNEMQALGMAFSYLIFHVKTKRSQGWKFFYAGKEDSDFESRWLVNLAEERKKAFRRRKG